MTKNQKTLTNDTAERWNKNCCVLQDVLKWKEQTFKEKCYYWPIILNAKVQLKASATWAIDVFVNSCLPYCINYKDAIEKHL